MAVSPGIWAVPGAAWPGAIWPGEPVVTPPFTPVIFSAGRARNSSGLGPGPVLTQLAASTVYIQVQVTATLHGAPYDPTGDTARIAFVPQPAYGPPPDPSAGQWTTAGWETDPGGNWVSILAGPANGGIQLTPGAYAVAVQVTDNPAVPVLWGSALIIT